MKHIFNKFNDINKRHIKMMEPLISIQNNLSNSILNYNLGLSHDLLGIGKVFENLDLNRFSNVFKKISEKTLNSLEKLPERTQKAIMILANEGWFIEAETPLELLFKTEHKTIDEVENLFILHYENNLDSIEKRLVERFPSRASILKKAFSAHRIEMYELTIPIFLIQSDGICFDLTQCHYFYQKHKLNNYLDSNLTDSFINEFLKPLKEKIPLSQTEKERGENFNKLNRHTILHGECTNYANKTNSLKVISFMAYLIEFLEKEELKNDLY